MRRYYDATLSGRIHKMGNPYMGPEMTSHMVNGRRYLVSVLVSTDRKRRFLDHVDESVDSGDPGDILPMRGWRTQGKNTEHVLVCSARHANDQMEADRIPRSGKCAVWFLEDGA